MEQILKNKTYKYSLIFSTVLFINFISFNLIKRVIFKLYFNIDLSIIFSILERGFTEKFINKIITTSIITITVLIILIIAYFICMIKLYQMTKKEINRYMSNISKLYLVMILCFGFFSDERLIRILHK